MIRRVSSVAVVGSGSAATTLAASARGAGLTVVGPPIEATAALRHELPAEVGRVLLAADGLGRDIVVDLALRYTTRDVPIWLEVTTRPELSEFLPSERIGDRDGVVLACRRESSRLRRLIDGVAAGLMILVLFPLLLVLGVLVKLSSRGPVLHRARVVGQDGRPFTWYKFRTMRVAGEDEQRRRDRFAEFVGGGGAPAKIVDESRVTAIGHILRRHSLDELPQLLSVLRGDMTLVGPRPCLEYEYELLKPWHRHRFAVRPGLTGLWQVRGRGRVLADDMAFMDICYALGRTWRSDVRVIAATVGVVLSGRGAI